MSSLYNDIIAYHRSKTIIFPTTSGIHNIAKMLFFHFTGLRVLLYMKNDREKYMYICNMYAYCTLYSEYNVYASYHKILSYANLRINPSILFHSRTDSPPPTQSNTSSHFIFFSSNTHTGCIKNDPFYKI